MPDLFNNLEDEDDPLKIYFIKYYIKNFLFLVEISNFFANKQAETYYM